MATKDDLEELRIRKIVEKTTFGRCQCPDPKCQSRRIYDEAIMAASASVHKYFKEKQNG